MVKFVLKKGPFLLTFPTPLIPPTTLPSRSVAFVKLPPPNIADILDGINFITNQSMVLLKLEGFKCWGHVQPTPTMPSPVNGGQIA